MLPCLTPLQSTLHSTLAYYTLPYLPYSTSFICHIIPSPLRFILPYPIPTYLSLPNSTALHSTLPSPWLSPPLPFTRPLQPSLPSLYPTLPYPALLHFTPLYSHPLPFTLPSSRRPPLPSSSLISPIHHFYGGGVTTCLHNNITNVISKFL